MREGRGCRVLVGFVGDDDDLLYPLGLDLAGDRRNGEGAVMDDDTGGAVDGGHGEACA